MSKKFHNPRKKKTKPEEPGRVELSEREKDDLINRLRANKLKEKDLKLLIDLVNAVRSTPPVVENLRIAENIRR